MIEEYVSLTKTIKGKEFMIEIYLDKTRVWKKGKLYHSGSYNSVILPEWSCIALIEYQKPTSVSHAIFNYLSFWDEEVSRYVNNGWTVLDDMREKKVLDDKESG